MRAARALEDERRYLRVRHILYQRRTREARGGREHRRADEEIAAINGKIGRTREEYHLAKEILEAEEGDALLFN